MIEKIDWYNVGHLFGMALPIGVGTILGSALAVMISFLILSFPLRLLIVYSKNYQIAMRCRMVADWMLVAIIVLVLLQGLTASEIFTSAIQPDKDLFWGVFLRVNASLMTVVPFYYIMLRITNRVEFYSDKHVKYLDYFILYLRRFKDDKKYRKQEKRLMKALKRMYFPFAIGRPNEFMPQRGAKRIYVGANWQDIVVHLQQKAPFILQKVNMSESFLWEFEQCVKGGHLAKVLFWVANIGEYEQFRLYAAEKYSLQFPVLSDMGYEQLFYQKSDGTFRIYGLENKQAYKQFADVYMREHPEHVNQNKAYLYGRRGKDLLRLAFSPVYDSRVMPGVNGWSWTGLFFPEFFVICHTIKYRFLLYFTFIAFPLFYAAGWLTNWQVLLLSVLFSLVMARNGRTLAWLSYKWESLEYFYKWYRSKDILAIVLGILRTLLWLGVGFFLMFNPFGWDIPHYDWALW